MENVKGLDVSHWVSADWSSWAAKGYEFVWAKASEGTTFVDNKYEQHTNGAVEDDFYVGPFHYFRVQQNGVQQALHFHSVVGNNQMDLPPVIDVEKYNNEGYSQATFRARLRNCLLETEDLFERRPVIYTSLSMWNLLVGSAVWATAYDLWVAHYTTRPVPLIPNDWQGKGWKVWQYIDRPLDQNRFDGDKEEFLKWIGQESPAPPNTELEERVAALEALVVAQHKVYHGD